jgi:hypothetical protein
MPIEDTDIIRKLEDLCQAGEVWEIARSYRIHRYRRRDEQRQTVDVAMMFNLDAGWKIIATDPNRGISVSGPAHADLNVVLATVRWQDLDAQSVPTQRSTEA